MSADAGQQWRGWDPDGDTGRRLGPAMAAELSAAIVAGNAGDPASARRAAELLELGGRHDIATQWWQYAAGLGDSDAVAYVRETLTPALTDGTTVGEYLFQTPEGAGPAEFVETLDPAPVKLHQDIADVPVGDHEPITDLSLEWRRGDPKRGEDHREVYEIHQGAPSVPLGRMVSGLLAEWVVASHRRLVEEGLDEKFDAVCGRLGTLRNQLAQLVDLPDVGQYSDAALLRVLASRAAPSPAERARLWSRTGTYRRTFPVHLDDLDQGGPIMQGLMHDFLVELNADGWTLAPRGGIAYALVAYWTDGDGRRRRAPLPGDGTDPRTLGVDGFELEWSAPVHVTPARQGYSEQGYSEQGHSEQGHSEQGGQLDDGNAGRTGPITQADAGYVTRGYAAQGGHGD